MYGTSDIMIEYGMIVHGVFAFVGGIIGYMVSDDIRMVWLGFIGMQIIFGISAGCSHD